MGKVFDDLLFSSLATASVGEIKNKIIFQEVDMYYQRLKAIARWLYPAIVVILGAALSGCATSPQPKAAALPIKDEVAASKPLEAISNFPSSSSRPAAGSQRPATEAKPLGEAAAKDTKPPTPPPPPPTTPLTLAECIKIALEQNPLNRAARHREAAARERVGEATSPYYPQISLNAGYSQWQKYAFLPSAISRPGMSKVIGPTDDWTAGLRARFLLFDSGERKAHLKASMSGAWAAEEEIERVRQEIIFQVHQAYYGLRSAQEARSIANKNLLRAEDHLRLAKERKEAGAVPKIDVIRAEGEVAQAKLAVVKTENLVRIAKGKLNIAMGCSVESWLEIADQTEVIKPPDEEINIYDALDQAILSRPDLKAARHRLAAARHEVRAAQSTFGPRISAEASYGWRGPEYFPEDKEWLAGVVLDWPIFTGLSSKHSLSRTRAELSKEEAELERLILAVQEEVWSSYSKLQETYEAINTAKAMVQTAEEGLRLARERYEAGSGSMNELLDTQTALSQAEASHLEAQWDYLIARANFQRSIGQLGK